MTKTFTYSALIILLIAAMIVVDNAEAEPLPADVGVSWLLPMARVDGSALPIDELSHSIVRWRCLFVEGEVLVSVPQISATVQIENYGKCEFTVHAVDIYEQMSAASDVAVIKVLPAAPKAPKWNL